MIACILESRGVRGKGENVEGVFMKCDVGASLLAKTVNDNASLLNAGVVMAFFASKLAPTKAQACLNISIARWRICASVRSSLWVARNHTWPNGSFSVPERSP